MADLAQTLDGRLPAGFDELPAATADALASAVDSAREHRRQRLDDAIEASLQLLPRVLRGAVRRALGIQR